MKCEEFRKTCQSHLDLHAVSTEQLNNLDSHVFEDGDDCEACYDWLDGPYIDCRTFRELAPRTLQAPDCSKLVQDALLEHLRNCDGCRSLPVINCDEHALLDKRWKDSDFLDSLWMMELKYVHENHCKSCEHKARSRFLAEHDVNVDDYPCSCLAMHSLHLCEQHEDAYDCPDTLIIKNEDGSFGFAIKPPCVQVEFNHCPWCGVSVAGQSHG